MTLLYLLIVGLFGLTIGSFIGALTYRFPHGISIADGRSFCPKCKVKISAYDNIPVLSYLLLKGRCRNCGKKISLRYPLIELGTGLLFIGTYIFLNRCMFRDGLSPLCSQLIIYKDAALPYLFIIDALLMVVFVTDIEHQLIPDFSVFLIIICTVVADLIFSFDKLYIHLLSGFAVSTFFLLLHLLYRGKAMGLGDVKLVLALGLIFGWPTVLTWSFLSFILGAVVGLGLILIGKASFGRQIAFGPFLIIAFFIVLIWGNIVTPILFPYLR